MPSIFTTAHLLRVNDYEFEDGGADRDKYMIVLYGNEDESYLIHCLTTKNNRLNALAPSFGCNVIKGRHFWYYPKGFVVGEKNYHFEVNTFVFFLNNIRKCATSKFDEQVRKGIFGIVTLDIIPTDVFKRLISCIISSGMAPEELEDELIYLKGTL